MEFDVHMYDRVLNEYMKLEVSTHIYRDDSNSADIYNAETHALLYTRCCMQYFMSSRHSL
jgi:hypothetical protein